jgi:hypothetical protein
MTLDEWIALTPHQRNVHRADWGRHDSMEHGEPPWGGLLREATKRFQSEFGNHPLINRIEDSAAICIHVTTALYPPQIVEEIPDRYCHFLVVQEPINASRDYYIRYWAILFEELLGWTEAQSRDWALRWDDELNGRTDGLFYHEDIYYYVLDTVLLHSGVNRQPPIGLFREIESAIQLNASSPIWLSPVDWNAVRNRVNDILSAIGGKLPR